MKESNFKDQVIWITGASSGIGAALALQLNHLGATVIASGRRTDQLLAVRKESTRIQNFIALPLDITDPLSIKNAVARVRRLGCLDGVVHNAGIAQKGTVVETELAVDRQIMETNFFGTVALTKAIMPLFVQQGYGKFAVVSSFAGVMGIPGRSAYAASKHALHGFFESLQAEHIGCKLNICFIIPGFIHTNITAKGLRGDGVPYGRVETSHQLGLTADQCAHEIVKGMLKKKRRIVVGKFEVNLLTIHRISPGLGRYIIRNHPMRKIRHWKSSIRSVIGYLGNPKLEKACSE